MTSNRCKSMDNTECLSTRRSLHRMSDAFRSSSGVVPLSSSLFSLFSGRISRDGTEGFYVNQCCRLALIRRRKSQRALASAHVFNERALLCKRHRSSRPFHSLCFSPYLLYGPLYIAEPISWNPRMQLGRPCTLRGAVVDVQTPSSVGDVQTLPPSSPSASPMLPLRPEGWRCSRCGKFQRRMG
jgi:hypothetical protein